MHKYRGSITAYVLVITFVSAIVLLSMVEYVSSRVRISLSEAKKKEAQQVSEAGIYFYKWYVAHNLTGKTQPQILDFWNNPVTYGISEPYVGTYETAEGNMGTYSITATHSNPTSTIVTVTSEGWLQNKPNDKKKIRVRFRRPSWGEYALLTNADITIPNSNVEINGKMHANGNISFNGLAHNAVSATGNITGTGTFEGGTLAPVPPESFMSIDFQALKQQAQSTGTYIPNSGKGVHVILRPNDTFQVCYIKTMNGSSNSIGKYEPNKSGVCGTTSGINVTTKNIPENGVIFVDADNVWVQGKINGKHVTIVSSGRMLLGYNDSADNYNGNLLYTSYDGSDTIGLIAQQDVEVVLEAPDQLRIDAYIVAQTGRVGRDHYSCAQATCKLDREKVTIYGGIASNQPFEFNYWDGGAVKGFQSAQFVYDNNLTYNPPPFFPAGANYVIDLWEEL